MRAIHLVAIARKSASCLLTLLLLASASAGRTNRVTIGTLTYLGTEGVVSAFRVMLDPSAVTSQSLSFANATILGRKLAAQEGPPLRLSREALVEWCALRDSNSRPSGS